MLSVTWLLLSDSSMCTIRRISHMKAKKVESTNTFNAKTQLEATSLSFQNIRQILFVFCFINFGNEQSTFQCL